MLTVSLGSVISPQNNAVLLGSKPGEEGRYYAIVTTSAHPECATRILTNARTSLAHVAQLRSVMDMASTLLENGQS